MLQQLVGHAHVDVAFEQRLANARQRFVHMLLCELSLPTQVFENSLQLVCQVLKHLVVSPLPVLQESRSALAFHSSRMLRGLPRGVALQWIEDSRLSNAQTAFRFQR